MSKGENRMSELVVRTVENGEEYDTVKVRNELATPETLKPNEYMLGSSWVSPEIEKIKAIESKPAEEERVEQPSVEEKEIKTQKRKSAIDRLFGGLFN